MEGGGLPYGRACVYSILSAADDLSRELNGSTCGQFLPSLCLFPVTQLCLVTMEKSSSMTSLALKPVHFLPLCAAIADTFPDGSGTICSMNVNLDGIKALFCVSLPANFNMIF